MNRRDIHRWVLFTGAILCAAPIARAQCLQWEPGFEPAGVGGGILALAEFDDGSGPQLYAAGGFSTAGTVHASNIAGWNGATWASLGTGLGSYPLAVTSFDDGNGMALYAGGLFGTAGGAAADQIAKWNGASWSALGRDSTSFVYALAAFDEGNGPVLFAAGGFNVGGPQRIVRWDGSTWSAVGGGLAGVNSTVQALTVFDDGTGPALYAAGDFTTADGAPASRIAKWDGSTWSPLGSGLDGEVRVLTAIDAGQPGGPALIAGGRFSTAGGTAASRVAKWDGTTWSALGSGIDPVLPGVGASSVLALTHFDSGSGPELYVGGDFVGAGGSAMKNLAKWDGSSWSSLGNVNDSVDAVRVFDDGQGAGPALYVAGDFTIVGSMVAHSIARWNGSTWSALGTTNGVVGVVRAAQVFDDGSGAALFVAGSLGAVGSVPVNSIGKWDGASWSDVGGGVTGYPGFPSIVGGGTVYALTVFDDGSGKALYAGGMFSHAGGTPASCVAKWDGVSWASVGAPFIHPVRALVVFDDGSGPALYAGGEMVPEDFISRWNGSSWQTVGTGMNNEVYALEVFTDSTGPALFAGGAFAQAGGVSAVGIAKWNGTSWSALGSGTAGKVYALEVYSGGTGVPALYAAGQFFFAGGISVRQIARWSGSAWSAVGPGLGYLVNALHVSDDGSGNGQALYAGGSFVVSDGAPANGLAKWNGTSWSDVGGGLDPIQNGSEINALASFDGNGDGRADFFAGGYFFATAGGNAHNFAQWRACAGPGTPYCFGDGTVAGPCPCIAPNVVPIPSGSNFGGCANSFNPHGAGVSATGGIQPDTVTLLAHGMSPVGFCQFFKTSATALPGIAVLDGISCASGSIIRFGSQNAVGGTAKYPNPSLGLTTPVSVRGATPVGSGLTGYYQVSYRNTKANFCTVETVNFSSSYGITWD